MKVAIALVLMTLAFGAGGGIAKAGSCPGGPAPRGAVVHGPVLEIPDASSLCLAQGQSRSTWVGVRLTVASETHRLLMAAAFGKNAVCAVGRDGLAACDIEGQPLNFELGRAETVKASLAWR